MDSLTENLSSTNGFAALLKRYKAICEAYEARQLVPLNLDAIKTRLGLSLYRNGPLSISELSLILGVSHPAILKIARDFIHNEWVADYRDRRDKRRRLLALTNSGASYFMGVSAHDAIRNQMLRALSEAAGVDQVLIRLERALQEENLEARVGKARDRVEIRRYSNTDQSDFERLNRAWIERYFSIEAEDLRIFSNPRLEIIQPGGEIFMAVTSDDQVVGTCAVMIAASKTRGELAKMAVHQHFQGLGIGRRLAQAAISWGKSMGLEKITLESNQRLRAALALYESLGFAYVESSPDSEFARADVSMVLVLEDI